MAEETESIAVLTEMNFDQDYFNIKFFEFS